MRILRTLPLCLIALVAFRSTPVLPQSPAPGPRILEKIDDNQLVPLKGNTVPAASGENDRGLVSPSLPMTSLVLVLSRSPEQQAAFDDFVAGQYDPTSPNFHRWLQPAEVGERFGPAESDIATLSAWLTGRGFTVGAVSKDRMTIRFSGTAAQVQAAFHTQIHSLLVRGENHIANISDPQIPAALAPVLAGVKGLHDFRPRPLHKLGSQVTFDSQTGKWQHATATPNVIRAGALTPNALAAHPDFGTTGGSGSNTYQVEDVAPYDFATIYNILPLWNAATPITGANQTIAIAGTSDITLSDVATFRTAFGLPAGLTPLEVKGANGLDPGVCTSTVANAPCTVDDLTENTLDVEWSGAVATGAQIVLVTSGQLSANDDTVYDSSEYVVENIGVSNSPTANAHILSVSYGLCELGEGTSGNAAYNNLWQTAATEGIAVFVASGDAGAATCDAGLDTTVPYAAQYGLSVSGLASTPYDTAVGGTDLNWGTKAAPDWNASNNATTGASAVGYMPEVPWNDTCTNPLTISLLQQLALALQKNGSPTATSPTDAESACQFVITWYATVRNTFGVDISSFVDVVGGGGGVSSCTTNDGQTAASCTGGYAKPTWQANVTGLPADGKRDLPDVSFFASNGFLGSAYLICVTADGACSYSATTETTAQEVGGTSVATPAMAGVMALINQKVGTPQGSPNAELYTLASKQTYASCITETGTASSACYFNDIDTGTIAVPCKPASPNCTANHTGDTVAVLSGFGATGGYDQATGLGSLNVANVVNGWTSSTGTGTATVTVAPSPTSLVVNQTLSVVVTVTGSGSTPTGTVTLSGGGYAGGAQTLASGTSTFNIPAYGLSGGTDTLVAGYSGDTNYAEANGNASVTVTKLTPSVTVTPGAGTSATNSQLTVTGVVTGSGPTPTGTVTLSNGSYSSSAATLTAGAYSIIVPAGSLTIGTDTLTAAYSGDGVYSTANGTAAVTVTPAAGFTLSATATTAISTPSLSATSTILVTSTTGYSGTVTLACTLNAGGPSNQTGDAPVCTIPSTAVAVGGKATATVTTTAATTGALVRPDLRRNKETLAGLGLAALALLALLGIPAQRRAFRALLGVFVLLLTLGSLAACGGGGGSSGGGGGGGTSNPGTTAGTYTFTVTGTGSPTVAPSPTTTFTVTVN